MKMNRNKLWKLVDKILWEEWDPIGVNESGPADEYQSYIASIVQLLLDNADTAKITKRLYHHANVDIGLSSNLEDHRVTAQKLKELMQ